MSTLPASRIRSEPFRPSAVMLLRIMKVLLDKNSVGRTELALEANVQYGRLVTHLKWLGERKLVEMVVKDGTINVTLTVKGKEFASMLLAIYGHE